MAEVGALGQKQQQDAEPLIKLHSIIDHVQLGLNYVSSFQEKNMYLFVFPCGHIQEFCPRVTTILDLQLTQEY